MRNDLIPRRAAGCLADEDNLLVPQGRYERGTSFLKRDTRIDRHGGTRCRRGFSWGFGSVGTRGSVHGRTAVHPVGADEGCPSTAGAEEKSGRKQDGVSHGLHLTSISDVYSRNGPRDASSAVCEPL